jgi:hypothetical protein
MFIICALLFMCAVNNTYSDKQLKHYILRLKNNALKRVIRKDVESFRQYLTRIRELNNQVLTKYYDSVYSFNLITDDDKILIEYIISLTF